MVAAVLTADNTTLGSMDKTSGDGLDTTVEEQDTTNANVNITDNRGNSPLSERIATVFVITVFSVTDRILSVFVREAKAL